MNTIIHKTPSVSFYTLPSVQKLLATTESDTKLFHDRISMTMEDEQLIYLMDMVSGKEDMNPTISIADWLHDIKVMLNRLGIRVYRLVRNIAENLSKQYTIIIQLWEKKLSKHLHDIDDEHFENTKIKCVPYRVLNDRIAVIRDISAMIEKIEAIVESPIDDVDDPNSYNTPIFVQLYKELDDIGFTMTNKTFTESRSQGYSSMEVEKTVGDLDYSKQTLVEMINSIKGISRLATKKWLTETVERFKKFNDSLVYKEKKLMDNNSIDEDVKKTEIAKVRIRISRLWWLSNFIHMLNVLTGDQMKYALKVFRAAEGAMPIAVNSESDGPGSKYF